MAAAPPAAASPGLAARACLPPKHMLHAPSPGRAGAAAAPAQQPPSTVHAPAAPALPRPLPAAAGLGAAPVLGIPAPPQQQQFAQQFSPGLPLGALPPSAAEEWDRAAVLMSVWLGCAVATLLLSILTFK